MFLPVSNRKGTFGTHFAIASFVTNSIVVAFTIEANQTRLGEDPQQSSEDSSPDEFIVPRPIRGLMTNHGYMVADPENASRSSIWFSGGTIEVQDEVADGAVWKQIFDENLVSRGDNKRAVAKALAAKLLLGAYTTTTSASVPSNHEEDSPDEENSSRHQHGSHAEGEEAIPTISYYLKRPIGGHGEVFCETLYLDESMRIMQGHHGSIFVHTLVPTE